MSIIKKLREKLGVTQLDLAEKTGLSLRTIQRLEYNNRAPKGHSLKELAHAFGIEPADLKLQFNDQNQVQSSEVVFIKFINLSALACIGIPFGNIILPIVLWKRKRSSKTIDESGKKIINFQILWTIVLCFLLSVSPFINRFFIPSKPLILIVLAMAFLFNFIVIGYTALSIHRKDFGFLNLPIRLL